MAEWSTNDLLTTALMNQKTVYIISGTAPGTAYDGQFYVDTSTDPPTVKVYDLTNTQWMTYHPVYYETQTGAWANPSTTPLTNGTLVVLYNSTQAGTRLYGYSNSGWVNLGGTLAQVYPTGDVSRMKYGVFALHYISAAEAEKLIMPVLSNNGRVGVTSAAETGVPTGESISAPTGGGDTMSLRDTIVVYDYAENIRRAEEVITATYRSDYYGRFFDRRYGVWN